MLLHTLSLARESESERVWCLLAAAAVGTSVAVLLPGSTISTRLSGSRLLLSYAATPRARSLMAWTWFRSTPAVAGRKDGLGRPKAADGSRCSGARHALGL